jgi:hypothetical protein
MLGLWVWSSRDTCFFDVDVLVDVRWGGSFLLDKWDMLSWSFMKLDFLKSAVFRIDKVMTYVVMIVRLRSDDPKSFQKDKITVLKYKSSNFNMFDLYRMVTNFVTI